MLRDEFNRLMGLFAQSAEGKTINLDELMKESVSFFEHLNYQLKHGTPDQRQDALLMMNDLYTEMNGQMQRICEKTGLSEEQLIAFSNNPANFSPEQWRSVEETKEKLVQVGKQYAPEAQVARPATSKLATRSSKPGSPRRKTRRSDWLKS